jgi:hypothetical protein
MKKSLTLLCIIIFSTLSIYSQEKKGSKEKIKALKIAYITEQLNLTPNEAEKFWPIYNIHDEKHRTLRSELRFEIKKTIKEKKFINTLSEKDAERLVLLKLSIDHQIHESEKKFIDQIKNIISYKKIVKLQLAEMDFGKHLIRRYKNRRGN